MHLTVQAGTGTRLRRSLPASPVSRKTNWCVRVAESFHFRVMSPLNTYEVVQRYCSKWRVKAKVENYPRNTYYLFTPNLEMPISDGQTTFPVMFDNYLLDLFDLSPVKPREFILTEYHLETLLYNNEFEDYLEWYWKEWTKQLKISN